MDLSNLFNSRRFWIAAAGVLFVLGQRQFGDKFPFTEEQVQQVVLMVAAWVLGDSLRSTGARRLAAKIEAGVQVGANDKWAALLTSKRFQVALAGVLLVVGQTWLGDKFSITDEQLQLILQLLATWVVGTSVRSSSLLPE